MNPNSKSEMRRVAVQSAAQESVLHEAQRIVHGPRQVDYGHPLKNFGQAAALWSVIIGHEVTAEQVGLCMIAMKLSRQTNRGQRDNLVDIAGYAETLNMIALERARLDRELGVAMNPLGPTP